MNASETPSFPFEICAICETRLHPSVAPLATEFGGACPDCCCHLAFAVRELTRAEIFTCLRVPKNNQPPKNAQP